MPNVHIHVYKKKLNMFYKTENATIMLMTIIHVYRTCISDIFPWDAIKLIVSQVYKYNNIMYMYSS